MLRFGGKGKDLFDFTLTIKKCTDCQGRVNIQLKFVYLNYPAHFGNHLV